MLIHEYSTTTSATYDRTTAATKLASNGGVWTTKSPHAIAFTIVLNCRQFVSTTTRLSDYGVDLAWYWPKFLNYLDLTEILILADKQNSIDISQWVTTGLTLPANYATMDQPKKALTVVWLKFLAANTPTTTTPVVTVASS